MKKHIFYPLIFTLFFSSCKPKEEPIEGSFFFVFYPRVCTDILILPAQLVQENKAIKGSPFIISSVKTVNEQPVKSKDFILSVLTGEKDLEEMQGVSSNIDVNNYFEAYLTPPTDRDSLLAKPILSLENQLEDDYRNRIRTKTATTRTQMYDAPNPWTYRVTGVKSFKISALSPLFGVAAGESLNRFFSIYEFEPKQVISSQSKNLLWGYKDKSKLERIEQWLSMKPMAPPQMLLRLNAVPNEAPTEVQFVTTLETNDGLLLNDTCKVYLK